MIRKKILLISSWYPIRKKPTLGNFVFKHAEAVAPFHDIFALHVSFDEKMSNKVEEDFQIHPFPSRNIYLKESRLPLLGQFINRIRILKQYRKEYERLVNDGFNPDLVHANVVYPIGIVAWYLKIKFKTNYIMSEHWTRYHDYAIPQPGFFQRNLIRFVANRALLILPASMDLGKAMKNWRINTPMLAIANVVNIEFFKPPSVSVAINKIKIIHISTLDNDQKNISLLLNAFAIFVQKKPNAELHIVTDGDFDFYLDTIKRLNIGGNVINHGCLDVEDVAEVLKLCDFFVLSSNLENLPCVLIESIACGVPVISTDVGGVKEIVDSTNGLVVPSNDLKALVEAMEQMAEKHGLYDKSLMHRQAREKYSYEAIGKQLAGVYSRYAN
jgi:glycosyltransferase involved in cell wall biosynthesis